MADPSSSWWVVRFFGSSTVSLLESQLHYARSVLYAEPSKYVPLAPFRPSRGVLPFLLVTTLCQLYCLLLYTTLPSASPSLALLRLASVPLLFAILLPVTFDKDAYTCGNDFQDLSITSFTWLPMVTILRLGVVSIWDSPRQRAPRWIVPECQAHRFEGAIRLDLPGSRAEPITNHAAVEDVKGTSQSNDTSVPTKSLSIPTVWYVLPLPAPWTLRRLLWAYDMVTMRRPGTSWIFPSEQRAMEWALPKLLATSIIYQEAAKLEHTSPSDAKSLATRRRAANRKRREAPIWFGQMERGLFGSIAQLAVVYAFARYLSYMSIPLQPSVDQDFFKTVPLLHQYILTIGLGSLVALTASAGELFFNSFLLHILHFPPTAVAPSFQRPIDANGTHEFWSSRWHQWFRREFFSFAKIIPGARHNAVIATVGSFLISGVEHSLSFSRYKPKPPTAWHVPSVVLLTLPFHIFFLSQALLILLEIRLLGVPSSGERRSKRVLRRALLWIGLLTTGRYVTGYLYNLGALHPSQILNWSKSPRLFGELWKEITG